MDHTPTTPTGDDRPFKILERTPVDDDHKERLFALVRRAQQAAADAGTELQGEFGRDAVAMIVGCNQFLRLYRGGEAPGRIEILVPDGAKTALAQAGFELLDPQGMVFKMFGWTGLDPMQGDLAVLEDAVEEAFQRATSSASSTASSPPH